MKSSLDNNVFPRITAGGDHFFFRIKGGRLFEGRRLFEGGDYFKYSSLEIVLSIFCFIITSNKLNMSFLSVPNLVP